MNQQEERIMYYGKGDVFVYRTYAKPLTGIKAIPESPFTGRSNIIFGLNAHISLKGRFLSSFTEGDNSFVIATDSMKNFIQRHAAHYEGSTIDGFLKFVSDSFLDTYAHVTSVKISAVEIPFDYTLVPGEYGLQESGLVFRHSRNEHARVTMEVARTSHGNQVLEYSSGIANLHLIKVSGSAFQGFIRDEYTTLPEETDRPLFIYLNMDWKYNQTQDGLSQNTSNYVPAEQVRDIARSVFHELYNQSIQHLIYHIGCRVLERFPQLSEISFETNNRTWDTVVDKTSTGQGKVYTEPRPPYGFQGFVVTRQDLYQNHKEMQENPTRSFVGIRGGF
ncbi:factor-independent urate hydroxylase [Thermoflavimicrobium daqui]|uniref:factor-independent urate hydroxylase n=1 Tax=Thermoflavimicrobium daqui TaxID=2137476 RepID=UPI0026AB457E